VTEPSEAGIRRWGAIPRSAHEQFGPEGDFCRQHLLNPVLWRMLGDVSGRRVLDAGSGQGYLCRLLAARGAKVVGLEPGRSLLDYAMDLEVADPLGIEYVEADLSAPPALGTFDVVVANVVLSAIPDWRAAMRACVSALDVGGVFVFSINHPCFEQLWTTWREHGVYRTDRYLQEYEIPATYAADFHRPLSAYLNELAGLGCRIREIAEPGLDPAVADEAAPGVEAYIELPNFLVVCAERAELPGE
jgi:2-polyprenyl-3-methyl-5-hydroxy-6-metoxy-1,4-benzoquinol methylase